MYISTIFGFREVRACNRSPQLCCGGSLESLFKNLKVRLRRRVRAADIIIIVLSSWYEPDEVNNGLQLTPYRRSLRSGG